jgi:hypothetical protein
MRAYRARKSPGIVSGELPVDKYAELMGFLKLEKENGKLPFIL